MALKKHDKNTNFSEEISNQPTDLASLLAQLGSADLEARRTAARDLAQYPEAAITLTQQLKDDTDKATREAIAISLIRIGGSVVVGELLPLLRSDNAALRSCVIDILKELPTDVSPHMEGLLDDADPDVRIFVVNVLEALRHPKVEDWLIAVISMDSHVNVVATALDLLGEVGTEAALPALEQVVARFPDEPFIAFAVEAAVKRIVSDKA